MYLHPTPDQVEALAVADPDTPIVMLNLLRFADQANPGFGCDGMTGHEAYREYGRRLGEMGERFPGQPMWIGSAEATVIGPPDEHWDEVILVRYDSIAAFLAMIADAEYQAASKARDAALADSRLVLMHEIFAA